MPSLRPTTLFSLPSRFKGISSLSSPFTCPTCSPRALPAWKLLKAATAPKKASFSTSPQSNMPEYKIKTSAAELKGLKDGQMQEAEIEGIENGKVLLAKIGGTLHATGPKCTHYGAPLSKGVLSGDGRVMCPWHGACFNVKSGDVEDAPALDPIATFEIVEKDDALYVKGDEGLVKNGRKPLDASCSSASGDEKIVVVGSGSGGVGTIEELRKLGFKGSITVLSAEGTRPFDRPKLSKALLDSIDKVAWRSEDFYKSASIDIKHEEVTSVDFSKKSVTTASGASYPYTKLVLASGGKPNALPLQGLKEGELQNVFLLRNLSHTAGIVAALGDGEKDPKKVVVIGSSFIGMEVAACISGMKHSVSVIGMESQPVEAVFGAKLGSVFRAMLEKKGVKFHMGASVSHATPSSSNSSAVGAVHLKDGTELPADVVIEGVGVKPATAFLANSPEYDGFKLNKDGSVTTDDNFAVKGVPDVFAVGDIATYPYKGTNVRIEHWNVAQNAGRRVARTLTGKKVTPFVPIFWSALGMQLRYCGTTVGSGYDDVVIVGETKADAPSFAAFYTKGDDVVAVATMGKDPVMTHSAELMRRGRMVGKKDLEGGKDVLGVSLA